MASQSISRPLDVVDLGRMRYRDAWKCSRIWWRSASKGEERHAVLRRASARGYDGPQRTASSTCWRAEVLERSGIEYYETDRGGDVTYHGPGQLVGYPILDLREWKRDVHAYFRGVEQALIDGLSTFGIEAGRIAERGYEGVWVNGAKIAAIGIHISRWIASHGFALNVDTDLNYFQYIVPCGLTKPVCSLRNLGCGAAR